MRNVGEIVMIVLAIYMGVFGALATIYLLSKCSKKFYRRRMK